MSAEWYYGQGGQRGGPVELSALQDMARTGRLCADDLVWRAGMANWQAASTVPEVASAFAPQPQVAQPVSPAQPVNQPQYGGYPQQQYPQQQYPQQGPYGGYPMPGQTNSAATTAMVMGILSLVVCAPLGIVAIIMGVGAKNNPVNRGQAVAGIVMGCISTALLAFFLLIFIIGIANS
ncbi:MAG: GYF domain-containing protein [Tepidisphaeraceae bacterium]